MDTRNTNEVTNAWSAFFEEIGYLMEGRKWAHIGSGPVELSRTGRNATAETATSLVENIRFGGRCAGSEPSRGRIDRCVSNPSHPFRISKKMLSRRCRMSSYHRKQRPLATSNAYRASVEHLRSTGRINKAYLLHLESGKNKTVIVVNRCPRTLATFKSHQCFGDPPFGEEYVHNMISERGKNGLKEREGADGEGSSGRRPVFRFHYAGHDFTEWAVSGAGAAAADSARTRTSGPVIDKQPDGRNLSKNWVLDQQQCKPLFTITFFFVSVVPNGYRTNRPMSKKTASDNRSYGPLKMNQHRQNVAERKTHRKNGRYCQNAHITTMDLEEHKTGFTLTSLYLHLFYKDSPHMQRMDRISTASYLLTYTYHNNENLHRESKIQLGRSTVKYTRELE
ncbi:hypothetical protein EVAR_62583_1 [Eumeta japonica]|uniref:Uncharacterized protein n=1 Tax=Eumeta variegata TaxID=151549 RepID=A0A4C1Y8D0_EUMVA|nr:hypothetical protein EVAR_62583_1 [Eumeta japonica]